MIRYLMAPTPPAGGCSGASSGPGPSAGAPPQSPARLGRMLELPVARPLPVQIPAVGLDELDDLADRHGLAQRRVSGISIRLQRSSLPVTLQGVFHLRRLTIVRYSAVISSGLREVTRRGRGGIAGRWTKPGKER